MDNTFTTFETKTATYYAFDYTTQDVEQYMLSYTAPAVNSEGRYINTYRFDTLEEFNQKLLSILLAAVKYELPLGNGKGSLFGAYMLDGAILHTLVDIW